MYKTELHAHTWPVSRCAQSTAAQVAEDYIQNGYSTLVLTNHMSPSFFEWAQQEGLSSWREQADLFLSDYRSMRKHAGDKLCVLLGMEVRVHPNMNDYLVYGIDEEFVCRMGNIMELSIDGLSRLVHDAGGLIYQAHPFRNGMTVTDPRLLDGIETANCCRSHDSRNEIAKAWAQRFGLRGICGSDYHRPEHMNGTGILTETRLDSPSALVSALTSMDFVLHEGKND